jgi:hypothetical protein
MAVENMVVRDTMEDILQDLDQTLIKIINNILCVGSPETLMSVGGFTLNH